MATYLAPIPLLPLPENFQIVDARMVNGQMQLSWQPGTNSGPYWVQGSPTLDGPWTNVGNPTMLLSTSFPPGENHFWKVQAEVPLFFTHTNQPRLSWIAPDIDMSDTLQNFLIQRRNDAPPAGQAISDNTGWTDKAQLASTFRSYNDTDPIPVPNGFWYRDKQTTVNGVVIPYNVQQSLAPTGAIPGTVLLQRMFGGLTSNISSGIVPKSICVDPSGNVIVCGIVSYTADCGGQQVTSYGAQDIVIAKWTASGTLLWVKHYGTVSNDVGFSVAANSSGQIFLFGNFSGNQFAGPVDIGTGGMINGYGQTDAVLIKFAPDGTLLDTKVLGGSGQDQGLSITIDASDNVLVCGSYGFFGTGLDLSQVGGPVLPITGRPDAYIVKLTSNLNYVWSRAVHTSSGDTCYAVGVSCDDSGNAYAVFKWTGTADFGSGTGLLAAAASNGMLAKYSAASGAWVWQQRIGTSFSGGMILTSVAAGSQGVAITGTWSSGKIDFGDGVELFPRSAGDHLTPGNIPSIFAAKYSLTGALTWKFYVGADDPSGPNTASITMDQNGNVTVAGYVITGINIDNTWYLGSGSQDILLIKFLSAAGPANLSGTADVAWAFRGAPGGDTSSAINSSPDGSLYVAGQTGAGGLTVGAKATILTPGTKNDTFWIKVAP